jgi:beta-lactamase class A
MILALLLAQQMVAPTAAVPVSERSTFDAGLRDAQNAAQALGGLLGASIQDLNTGVSANVDGDQPFVLAGMERVPEAILAARPGTRFDGIDLEADGTAFASANAFAHLLSMLYTDTLLPKPQAQALLQSLDTPAFGGRLRAGLPAHAQLEHVTGTLETADVAQAVNDAGIANVQGHVLIIVAMLHDAGGTQAQRDAVIAHVASAAVSGALASP